MPKYTDPYKTIVDLQWAHKQGYITTKEMRAVNLDWARAIEFDAARLDDHLAAHKAEWAELDNPPVYPTGSMVCISYNFENTNQYGGYPAKGTMGLGMVLRGNEDKSLDILVMWHVEPRLPADLIDAAEEWARNSTNKADLVKIKKRSTEPNFQYTESVLRHDGCARYTGCHISKWAPVPHAVF
jgi:hypothetical protein